LELCVCTNTDVSVTVVMPLDAEGAVQLSDTVSLFAPEVCVTAPAHPLESWYPVAELNEPAFTPVNEFETVTAPDKLVSRKPRNAVAPVEYNSTV
jgi:tRNA G37 N-methylase TrmD